METEGLLFRLTTWIVPPVFAIVPPVRVLLGGIAALAGLGGPG